MSVRSTSAEAYRAIEEGGFLGKRRWEVYDILFRHGPLTASETYKILAQEKNISLGFMHNNHSRFSELRTMGVVKEVGTKTCSVTNMTVILWDVTDHVPSGKYQRPRSNQEKIKALSEAAEISITCLKKLGQQEAAALLEEILRQNS